jgi:hypothetical protein
MTLFSGAGQSSLKMNIPPSGNTILRDNHNRGTVGDFLRETIRTGSRLSIVSAYFTIYTYDALEQFSIACDR